MPRSSGRASDSAAASEPVRETLLQALFELDHRGGCTGRVADSLRGNRDSPVSRGLPER